MDRPERNRDKNRFDPAFQARGTVRAIIPNAEQSSSRANHLDVRETGWPTPSVGGNRVIRRLVFFEAGGGGRMLLIQTGSSRHTPFRRPPPFRSSEFTRASLSKEASSSMPDHAHIAVVFTIAPAS